MISDSSQGIPFDISLPTRLAGSPNPGCHLEQQLRVACWLASVLLTGSPPRVCGVGSPDGCPPAQVRWAQTLAAAFPNSRALCAHGWCSQCVCVGRPRAHHSCLVGRHTSIPQCTAVTILKSIIPSQVSAEAIATLARQHASDPSFASPYTREALSQG